MTADFFIILFVARYLRNSLKNTEYFAVWNRRLNWAMYGSIAMIIVEIGISKSHPVMIWVGGAALIGLIYLLYAKPEFKHAKPVYVAIAPYIIVSFFTNIIKVAIPSFYASWASLLGTLNLFSIIWGIGVWIVTVRQRKELEKTRKKVEEEKANNKIVSAMKAELEVQVAERTAELTKQKEELEVALEELKSTQAQLIQSEKMASLGELTAGIAHEIQNPLNFVNNFSEVNTELIEELKVEKLKAKTDRDEILENELLSDISQNLEKISYHGKRADAIVKGMLQHSRKNTGQKEPADINDLCDEYLRLSYHGLRAKDKSFNADFKTDFDTSIEKIEVVPQDIGRVFLNLFNNAFYAVSEKKKTAGENYKPLVSVATKKFNSPSGDGGIEIKVSDNGNGIPQNIVDKIFQPFFTTKPTGQGTGLGLSLSYDIIRAHGGEIKAETKENEGSEFTIQLPAQ